MRIPAFFLCESASQNPASGYINIQSAALSRLILPSLPGDPEIALFAIVALDPEDSPGVRQATITLRDEDGERIVGKLDLPLTGENAIQPFSFQVGLIFERNGYARFILSVEGFSVRAEWPLEVSRS